MSGRHSRRAGRESRREKPPRRNTRLDDSCARVPHGDPLRDTGSWPPCPHKRGRSRFTLWGGAAVRRRLTHETSTPQWPNEGLRAGGHIGALVAPAIGCSHDHRGRSGGATAVVQPPDGPRPHADRLPGLAAAAQQVSFPRHERLVRRSLTSVGVSPAVRLRRRIQPGSAGTAQRSSCGTTMTG